MTDEIFRAVHKDHRPSWSRFSVDGGWAGFYVAKPYGNGGGLSLEMIEGHSSGGRDMRRVTMMTLTREEAQELRDALNKLDLGIT